MCRHLISCEVVQSKSIFEGMKRRNKSPLVLNRLTFLSARENSRYRGVLDIVYDITGTINDSKVPRYHNNEPIVEEPAPCPVAPKSPSRTLEPSAPTLLTASCRRTSATRPGLTRALSIFPIGGRYSMI